MSDQPRPRRGRPGPPRPAPPPAAPAPLAPPAPRPIPPSSFREHLETEHGLTIVAEPGWPTEYKRYYLVRRVDETEKRLAAFKGRFPEAVTHFYYLLHPEQRPRR